MKYPIGIQDFSQIREEGYVYIDKPLLDVMATGIKAPTINGDIKTLEVDGTI